MTERMPSPSFEAELRGLMASPDAAPEFVDRFRADLLARVKQKPSNSTRTFRLRPVWMVSLAILFLLILATIVIGPQRVLAAVRGLFGYLPGIGMVQNDSGLRVLAEPVEMVREGITVRVEQGAADRQRTVIVYSAEGLSVAAANSQGEGASVGGLAVLLLPDGSILTQTAGGGGGWGVGYKDRLIFPPIPDGVIQVTLMISRLQDMPSGAAPEDWRLALRFKPAPADMEMLPVYELATPAAAAAASSLPPGATPTPGAADVSQDNVSLHHGIQLSLDKVAELEDGFLLQGSAAWSEQDYANVSIDSFYPLYPQDKLANLLTDAQGQVIPVERVNVDDFTPPSGLRGTPWAFRTNSKGYPAPWTYTIPEMQAMRSIPPGQVQFQIDLGSDPQVGQTFQINQELTAGGKTFKILSASLGEDRGNNLMSIEFVIAVDSDDVGVNLDDPANQPEAGRTYGGGGGGPGPTPEPGIIRTGFSYYQKPSGVRTIEVNTVSFTLQGPWQVSWNPAEVSGKVYPTPTPQPQVCLDADTWQQVINEPAGALPEGLAGRLLLQRYTGEPMPQLSLANLDGSQLQDITFGGWSALSPDSSSVVLIKSDGTGLYLADMHTGEERFLPGTGPNDYRPVWSRDGNWIAFERGGESAIYRIHPDGTGLSRVLKLTGIGGPSDWMPDNRRIVYQELGPEGVTIRAVDAETGGVQDLIQTGLRKNVSFPKVSPDGRWVAFRQPGFGMDSYGIFLAHPDGSGQKLLVAGLGAMIGAWSPDGKWLAMTVTEWKNADEAIYTSLLIQPDTCQVVKLAGISGEIIGWGLP